MRKDIVDRKPEIEFWISEFRPKSFICEQLKCKPSTLDSYLHSWNIYYGGNRGRKGFRDVIKDNNYKTVDFYLGTGKYISNCKLRDKLIREGFKDRCCEGCGLREWLGVPIPLEVHHVDGDRFNNSLDNLKFLCPNCHSLTPNYGSKNKHSG